MKKIALVLIFTSWLFANSPSALKDLTREHTDVFPTHEAQYATLIKEKILIKDLLSIRINLAFELDKFRQLIFNGFLIRAEKDF